MTNLLKKIRTIFCPSRVPAIFREADFYLNSLTCSHDPYPASKTDTQSGSNFASRTSDFISALIASFKRPDTTTVAPIFFPFSTLYSARALRMLWVRAWKHSKVATASSSLKRGVSSSICGQSANISALAATPSALGVRGRWCHSCSVTNDMNGCRRRMLVSRM